MGRSLKARLCASIVSLLEADARGRDELLKEFWEDCTSKEEVAQGQKLLGELLEELRARAAAE